MVMTEAERETERAFQDECARMVHNNVHYCVSMLISELAQDEKYVDELAPILSGDDWTSPAEAGVDDLDEDECREELEKAGIDIPYELQPIEEDQDGDSAREAPADCLKGLQALVYDAIGGDIDAREFCDRHNLDPETNEAYEHWIVSDWLAAKLEAQGEMVTKDFMGLTIWGRCTSGQAISMDGVIRAIAASLKR